MNRIGLTKNLWLDEYIPKELYLKFEKKPHILIGLIDRRLVMADQLLRDKFGSVTINNWWNGGNRNWSGIRTPDSPVYSQTSQHCFDKKTKILTNKGWFSIDDEIDDSVKVVTLNPENSKIELKDVFSKSYFKFKGDLFGIKTKHIDSLTTPNHRNYCTINNKKHKYKFESSENIYSRRRFFKRSGISTLIEEKLTDLEYLAIATVCDGSIGRNSITFHLSKKRKINKLKEKFDSSGYSYKIYKDINKDNTYYFTTKSDFKNDIVDLIGKNKSLNFCYNITNKAKDIINTYTFYDGHTPTREGDKYSVISSINEDNINILSYLCVLAGMSQTIATYPLKDFYGQTDIETSIFNLYITNYSSTRVNKDRYYKRSYDGYVWCLNNENTTLFVQRNGKVFISGNSWGRASDKIFTNATAHEVREYIKGMYEELGITCIEENVTWVHSDVRWTRSNELLIVYP